MNETAPDAGEDLPSVLPGPAGDEPPGFYPFKLVLQPSGLVINLARPNLLVGRHSDADIRLPLPDVSRRHCRFMFVEGGWRVVDLESLNGTHVNGERLRQAEVRHGDLVRIGGFTFLADLSEADPGPAEVLRSIADALPRQAAGERRKAS